MRLQFIRGVESATEAALIAMSFETGLEQFYRTLLERSELSEVRDLLGKLIRAEENHARKLLRLLESPDSGPAASPPPDHDAPRSIKSSESHDRIIEGGLKINDLLS